MTELGIFFITLCIGFVAVVVAEAVVSVNRDALEHERWKIEREDGDE